MVPFVLGAEQAYSYVVACLAGMTGGTIAAIVISQQILGMPCPWKKVRTITIGTTHAVNTLLPLHPSRVVHVPPAAPAFLSVCQFAFPC